MQLNLYLKACLMSEVNGEKTMKKFIVIYHASASAMERMQDASQENMNKGMEQWQLWAEKCGSGLVDLGTPLGGGQKLTHILS